MSKVSGATRADLAAAAAMVLAGQGHAGSPYGSESDGRVYQLGGTPFTLGNVAAEISRQSGKPLVYQDLPVDQYAQALAAQGVPRAFADSTGGRRRRPAPNTVTPALLRLPPGPGPQAHEAPPASRGAQWRRNPASVKQISPEGQRYMTSPVRYPRPRWDTNLSGHLPDEPAP